MRPYRPASNALSSPMKRNRTPLARNSSTSLSRARTNRFISAPTSSRGRSQFSLENANKVRACTPSRRQASITVRTALRPALWPKLRGRWRARAQRPLPSMTMATCSGAPCCRTVSVASGDGAACVMHAAGWCGAGAGCAPARMGLRPWPGRAGRGLGDAGRGGFGGHLQCHQLVFFGLDGAIDFLDGVVGEVLHFLVEAAFVVFGDELFLEQVLHLLQG